MSIRTRLAIAVALVVIGVFVLSGVFLVRSTRATLVEQVDYLVKTNSDRWMKSSPPGDDHPPSDSSADQDDGGGYGGYYGGFANNSNATESTSDSEYSVVARLSFSKDGTPRSAQPCGFRDEPKPYPTVPTIPG